MLNKYFLNKEKINIKEEIKFTITVLLVFIIPSILTFLQPDTGAVVGYLIITIATLFIANLSKKLYLTFLFVFISLLIIFIFIYINYQDLLIDILGTNFLYRIDRIINWQSKSGMQLNNSLIAIGSSGLFGKGKIPLYFPEAETDFIFTSFSSSYGIFSGMFLIIILFSFDFYLLSLIKDVANKQNKNIIFIITSLFIFQHIQSIGMSLGLLPIMGISLPFISYGGTSIISNSILLGIIINIVQKKRSN